MEQLSISGKIAGTRWIIVRMRNSYENENFKMDYIGGNSFMPCGNYDNGNKGK